jgi:hypothetical protein
MHDKWKAPEAGAGGAGHRPAVIEDASLGDASSALFVKGGRAETCCNAVQWLVSFREKHTFWEDLTGGNLR